MQGQSYGRRQDNQDRLEQQGYSFDDDEIQSLLEDLGIEYAYSTSSHHILFCPIHSNTSTPSATISKENSFFYCFSAECEAKMHLVDLIREVKGCGLFPALRMLKRHEVERDVAEGIKEIFAKPEEIPPFDPDLLKRYQEDFWNSPRAKNYIKSRGITRHSAEIFGLGYDKAVKLSSGEIIDMVVTPMYDTNGVCIGVVKRSIDGKEFKNSYGLPKGKSLFNIHLAKRRATEKVVICESNFDAIRATQAGYSAVALLGAGFNDYHCNQLRRSFSKVIIATDTDEAGIKLANTVAKKCRSFGLAVYRVRYSEAELLPHGAKDLGDLTDDEIAQSIRLARPYV